MKIEFKRINDAYLMEAVNENGNTTLTDGSPDIGGSNLAMRPMQLMLVGLGSCSSIDVIHLLQKQRQDLRDIQLSVTAEREEGVVPSLFTTIHIHYKLFGPIDPKKAERAISLSVEKYCSVGKLLEKTADITWDFEIIPVEEEIQN
ncbi:MAG: OsmC family protein [Saprospiraceae bacterium]|jgi:putative redox protein|nr:OsmC family protein [Saprospiraceae bacterium]MDP4820011.1 OsmC family protein [Saprospiraceae bacterium]MDP4997790.1 OsmC family protein [Saprospiraceae bacterium]